MPRHRADGNQSTLAKLYEQMGCSVLKLSAHYSIDLLVGCAGKDVLVEIKDSSKPPSQRALTPRERKFHDDWRGQKPRIVMDAADVVDHVQEMRGCVWG